MTPKEETERLRKAMEAAGYQHAPEFETDDFIFPKGTEPSPEEQAALIEKLKKKYKNLDQQSIVVPTPFNFSDLVRDAKKKQKRTEEEKLKEDYYHLLRFDNKTFCGIDTLTSLTADEGGQWREGCSPAEFSAKPCPACVKARQSEPDDEENPSGSSFSLGEDESGPGEAFHGGDGISS